MESDARNFIDGLPDPPMSFVFTERQRYDQLHFFAEARETLVLPPVELNVDLYNANIIVVCRYSQTLSQFTRLNLVLSFSSFSA